MIPSIVPNWISGEERFAVNGSTCDKFDPSTGSRLCQLTASNETDVHDAVEAAQKAQTAWAKTPPVQRGDMIHAVAMGLQARREEIAKIVAAETGKSQAEALGETDGAIRLALFYAGEGQRLYGRTTTSGVNEKYVMTVRQPAGVAGLIVAANTPIANVAWKIFPALICGNGVVLKAAEDTPATAWAVGDVAKKSGLPDGLLNIVQGTGKQAGMPLVAHPDVNVVSFTGSTKVGRLIARVAGERLAKVSLELGGKNPLIVCDDADIDNAVKWILLSAFSNAGQRCASCSRVIIFDSVYEKVRDRLVAETKKLRVGPTNDDDYGPVINERQLDNILKAIENAQQAGGTVLTGGHRVEDETCRNGYYVMPTIIDGINNKAAISRNEIFGPVTCLYRAQGYAHALELANDSPYGLTASIHTRNMNRAWDFTNAVQAGVAVINGGTYGSEPHMPFGGYGQSGNGSREPGTEALDVYSELRSVHVNVNPDEL